MDVGELLLLVGGVLAASVLVALGAARVGVPTLVAFLGLGMVLGSEGPGGIAFNNVDLARTVGVVGLVAILYEGGLSTSWRRLRPVAVPAALLSTVGVVVTALLAGLAAFYLFHLPWLAALLLGAVVSSTDAAAVFAALRHTRIRRRLARTLEAETGLNDPIAITLTLGLIAWIQQPTYDVGDVVLLFVRQLGLGLVIGLACGAVASWAFGRLPQRIGPFATVASVAAATLSFGLTAVAGGSGFLAVYLVGLAVGSTPSRYRRQLVAFHEGLAFLAQVVLFVVLGLLVFPDRLAAVIGPGIALSAVLVIAIRPIAVFLSTITVRFTGRERLLMGWAGLRGAAPIVLATFVLSSHIGRAETIFDAVFFVVVVSTLLQGTTLEPVARRLGLVEAGPGLRAPPIEVDVGGHLDLVEFDVTEDHAIAGATVSETGLPRGALIAVVVRGGDAIPPRGSTVIQPGDRLYVLVPLTVRPTLDDVFVRWRRRV